MSMRMYPDNLSLIIGNKVKNIPHKLKREFYRIPLFQSLREQKYQKTLNNHALLLPQISPQDTKILNGLHQNGTYVIPIEELELSSSSNMMEMVNILANNLKSLTLDRNQNNNCEIGSNIEEFREYPKILLWALETRLLNIIENYIGLPIIYQGFAMRRGIADGKYSGVRQWHIDWEDRRLIKIIIYLNDVDINGGPYEYIPRNLTAQAIEKLNYYNLGYVSDEEMETAIPKTHWRACEALKGSVIITDSSSVFHRAKPPTKEERFSITLCYTSINPQVMWRSRGITVQQWQLINSQINQRQKNCLPQRQISQFL